MKTQAFDAGLATGLFTNERATERGTTRRDGSGAFAGLLDGERQRLDARAEERSAFDTAKPAVNTEAAQAERRQLESRRAQAQQAERREPPEQASTPTTKPGPAQAKPGSEPTPQRAGLPTAKRIETAPAEAPTRETAAADATKTEATASEATDAATTADAATPHTAPATDNLLADPALRWSSTLALQVRPEADGARAGGDANAPSLAATSATHAGHAGADLRADLEPARTSDAPSQARSFEAELGEATQEVALAVTAAADAPAGPRLDAAPAGLAPSLAPAAPAASSAPGVPVPAQASLPAPMDSPVFGQQLGFQLASFVQDGVQHAELQLNPAEMGPVAVHIVLDGNQAQIDFAAAQQRTREVLEAHWPALAAALHGAGFTLGGGGVSEQASQGRDGPGEGRGGRATRALAGIDAAEAPAVRAAVGGKRGLLDLYA